MEPDIPLQTLGKATVTGKIIFEKVLLISKKKISKDDFKYLQVSIDTCEYVSSTYVYWQYTRLMVDVIMIL